MDISYFAGFFDADGSVSIAKNQKGTTLTCTVYNSNKKVLEIFRQNFGGEIYISHNHPEKGWKTGYRWMVAAKKAEEFLSKIVPFVTVKKERVELGLQFRILIKENKNYGVITERDEKGRMIKVFKKTRGTEYEKAIENFYQKIKQLNRRGVSTGLNK